MASQRLASKVLVDGTRSDGSPEASLKRKSLQRRSPRFAGRREHQTSHHRFVESTCFFKLASPRGRILPNRQRQKIRRRLASLALFLLKRTRAKRRSSLYDTWMTFRTNFFPKLALIETTVPPSPARHRTLSQMVCTARRLQRCSRQSLSLRSDRIGTSHHARILIGCQRRTSHQLA